MRKGRAHRYDLTLSVYSCQYFEHLECIACWKFVNVLSRAKQTCQSLKKGFSSNMRSGPFCIMRSTPPRSKWACIIEFHTPFSL